MIVTAAARKLLLSSRWVGRIGDQKKLERQRSEWEDVFHLILRKI
jgi:hypothetical protein